MGEYKRHRLSDIGSEGLHVEAEWVVGVQSPDPGPLLELPAGGVRAELDAADGEAPSAARPSEVAGHGGVGTVGDAAEVLGKAVMEAARGLSNVTGAAKRARN